MILHCVFASLPHLQFYMRERPGPLIQNNGIDGILATDASTSMSW